MTSRTFVVALFVAAVAATAAVPALAQSSPGHDRLLAPRKELPPPRHFSTAELEALRGGLDMGLARAADQSGLPAPERILEAASTLELSASQIEEIGGINAVLLEDAQRLGRGIIEQESRLDSLFAAGDPRDWNVRPVILEVGRLQTELRYVHLRARMRMREVLTSLQVARYSDLMREGVTRAESVED